MLKVEAKMNYGLLVLEFQDAMVPLARGGLNMSSTSFQIIEKINSVVDRMYEAFNTGRPLVELFRQVGAEFRLGVRPSDNVHREEVRMP
jgi:hypothetical protein